jgi:hypothetical protein
MMASAKQIIGTFLKPDGTVAAGATAYFELSSPQNSSLGIIGDQRISQVLDADGTLGDAFYLMANDEFENLGSWYTVSVVDPTFGRILFGTVAIIGTSPINLADLEWISVE